MIQAIWFLIPLMVINTVSVWSVNVNIIYLLSFVSLLKKNTAIVPKYLNVFLPFFVILILRSLMSGQFNQALFMKLAMSLLFFVAIYELSGRIALGFKAYMASIKMCIVYGMYQYMALFMVMRMGFEFDLHRLLVLFSVHIWNPNYWHFFAVRGGMIMVPSFALEPAYFTIFLAFALFISTVFQKKENIRSREVLLILFGFLMTYSRNGLIFLAIYFTLIFFYKKIPVFLLIALLLLSYVVPIFGSFALDYASRDLSVVARALPLKIFFLSEAQTPMQMMFGISDRGDFLRSTKEYSLLESVPFYHDELKMLASDPKSFVANTLYNFGIVGLLAFWVINAYNFRKNKLCLVLLIAFNLVTFNVNVLYWPVYWAFYLSLIVYDKQEREKEAEIKHA